MRSALIPTATIRGERRAVAAEIERSWGTEADLGTMIPNADPAMRRWWAERARASASPGAARDLILTNSLIDVRHVLAAIHVPTLVMHRTGDRDAKVEEGRYIAARIVGARFVELPGDVHVPWVDADPIVDETEGFLTGARRGPEPDRVLTTILFTDLVGSTARAAELGDSRWKALLDAHHRIVRRELERFRGEEIDTAGDGFLATFDGPARAIRCACSVRDSMPALELELRAGVHTGEVILAGDKIRGIAVHTGARIAALASAGEVLVSATVRDLVAGSGLQFEDRGEHALEGVPGASRLYAVAAP